MAELNPSEPAPEPVVDPYKDILSQITNPEGNQKYADPLTALQSIKPKDEMIVSLQAQIAAAALKSEELETELASRTSNEELVRQVMENQQAPEPQAATPAAKEAGQEIDIGELVRREVAGLRKEDTKVANRSTVASALADKFGDKAKEVLETKMTELGISSKFFAEVSEQSSDAALALLGITAQAPATPAKPLGSVRAEQFNQPAPAEFKPVLSSSMAEQTRLWDQLVAELNT